MWVNEGSLDILFSIIRFMHERQLFSLYKANLVFQKHYHLSAIIFILII